MLFITVIVSASVQTPFEICQMKLLFPESKLLKVVRFEDGEVITPPPDSTVQKPFAVVAGFAIFWLAGSLAVTNGDGSVQEIKGSPVEIIASTLIFVIATKSVEEHISWFTVH